LPTDHADRSSHAPRALLRRVRASRGGARLCVFPFVCAFMPSADMKCCPDKPKPGDFDKPITKADVKASPGGKSYLLSPPAWSLIYSSQPPTARPLRQAAQNHAACSACLTATRGGWLRATIRNIYRGSCEINMFSSSVPGWPFLQRGGPIVRYTFDISCFLLLRDPASVGVLPRISPRRPPLTCAVRFSRCDRTDACAQMMTQLR
jgi:hypothetical protein